MEWIWVIILLFSVFANLMDKMAKERQRTESSTDSRGEELETSSGRPTESFPRMDPELAPVWKETLPDRKLPDHSQAQKGLVTAEEWNQLFTPEQDRKEDDSLAMVTEDKNWELTTDSDEWWGSEESSAHQLVDAFVLAHALLRPDFRTIPWRRRL